MLIFDFYEDISGQLCKVEHNSLPWLRARVQKVNLEAAVV